MRVERTEVRTRTALVSRHVPKETQMQLRKLFFVVRLVRWGYRKIRAALTARRAARRKRDKEL